MTDTENEIRELICKFLTSAAVADHLGDIRNSEFYLWNALGVSTDEYHEATYETDGEPVPTIRVLAAAHALPFPEYILEDDD